MDNLSWDNPSALMNEISIPPSYWSSPHDNYLQSSADWRTISSEVEPSEALLKSISELQGIKTCEAGSDLDRLNQIVESINGTLDPDLLQHQQTIRLAAIDTTLATFGQGTIWGDALTCDQLYCSSPMAMNPMGNPLQHFGSLKELHPLDDDEDGVSTIFSSSENIRNLSSSGNISSGESENHDSYKNLEVVSNHYPVHNEVTAQCSSTSHTNKRKLEDFDGRESCHPNYDLLQSSTSTTTEGGFKMIFENSSRLKKLRSAEKRSRSSNIDFRQESGYEPDTEAIAQVKEMIYRAAALRPVSLGVEDPVEKPRRKNVRISSDPQTVAARHRRERISERLRVLQRLVPGGSKMDTASMLDEAANYLKFLKSQVSALEAQGNTVGSMSNAVLPFPTPFNQAFPMQTGLFPLPKP